MDPLAFEYRLIGDGFCDVFFRVGDAELDLHQLGDSPDPLEEVMRAALALARGEEPPRVFWDPEDGGLFWWSIERSADQLHLRVDYVDDQDHRRRGLVPDVPAAPFVATMSVHRFCSLIAEGAARVIERYGSDRYRELWLSPFPAELLRDLESAIASLA